MAARTVEQAVAVAISLAVYLATGPVLDSSWPPVFTAAVALWFALWWFLVPPFWRRGRRPEDAPAISPRADR